MKVGKRISCQRCGFQVNDFHDGYYGPTDTQLYDFVQELLPKGKVAQATELMRKERGLIFEDAKDFKCFCYEWGMPLPNELVLENIEPKAWRAVMAISPWTKLESYQEQFDKEARIGLLFSLLWILGIGSIVGIVIGVRACLIILEAAREVGSLQKRMTGLWKLWICFALSIVGILLAIFVSAKFLI